MTEYAIIRSGSKQYRVKAGDIIDVDLLEPQESGALEFKEVLCYANGTRFEVEKSALASAVVKAVVVDEVRGPKVIAYKYKRRKRSTRRKVGHRQHYTRVKITQLAI